MERPRDPRGNPSRRSEANPFWGLVAVASRGTDSNHTRCRSQRLPFTHARAHRTTCRVVFRRNTLPARNHPPSPPLLGQYAGRALSSLRISHRALPFSAATSICISSCQRGQDCRAASAATKSFEIRFPIILRPAAAVSSFSPLRARVITVRTVSVSANTAPSLPRSICSFVLRNADTRTAAVIIISPLYPYQSCTFPRAKKKSRATFVTTDKTDSTGSFSVPAKETIADDDATLSCTLDDDKLREKEMSEPTIDWTLW